MLLHMAHKARNLQRKHMPLGAIFPGLSRASSSLDLRLMVKARLYLRTRLLLANKTKCCCSLTWLPSNNLFRLSPVTRIAGIHPKVLCKNGRSLQRMVAGKMRRSRWNRVEVDKTSPRLWIKRRESCPQRMESLCPPMLLVTRRIDPSIMLLEPVFKSQSKQKYIFSFIFCRSALNNNCCLNSLCASLSILGFRSRLLASTHVGRWLKASRGPWLLRASPLFSMLQAVNP